LLGTLGMMLEVSEVGAVIELQQIPIPDGMDMPLWLRMYPGMGFLLTAQPEHVQRVLHIFEEADMRAAKIGEITETKKLEMTSNAERAVVWDFNQDTIMGIGPVTRK